MTSTTKACQLNPSMLITDGKLENYLIGRAPIRDFPQSNGHGRAGVSAPARPSIGVLKITAPHGLTDDELNKKLLDLAKDRDLKSVYYVRLLVARWRRVCSIASALMAHANWFAGLTSPTWISARFVPAFEAAGKDLWVANYAAKSPKPSSHPRSARRRNHPPRQREKRQTSLLPGARLS